ncbi:MAG: 3-methyl-2-oxobutanoate hydroxymethyltransferase, partial [Cyanobacteriota bacterium]|nr:3-methyl-2-oxobutanoate hydroxymethyltransferase [Cyanobacteriota bacterium]
QLLIPVIGIGAGPGCDGQVLVTADLLGLTPRQPPFAQPLVNLRQQALPALRQWVAAQRAPTSSAASPAPHC